MNKIEESERDNLLLKEQIRVADVAFQSLFERNKEVEKERDELKRLEGAYRVVEESLKGNTRYNAVMAFVNLEEEIKLLTSQRDNALNRLSDAIEGQRINDERVGSELTQLRAEYKNALEAIGKAKQWIEVGSTSGCDCATLQHCSYCSQAISALNSLNRVLSTPSAIAAMK